MCLGEYMHVLRSYRRVHACTVRRARYRRLLSEIDI